jgi:hypothetical protein
MATFNLLNAFDCTDHKILLSKLKFYGVTRLMYKLIKYYLNDRYQQVKIDSKATYNVYLNWGKVSKSVPQGYILGPFLF